jgi:hypothetical protein
VGKLIARLRKKYPGLGPRLETAAPFLVLLGIIVAVVFGVSVLFGGGGDENKGGTAFALQPANTSWVIGQESLASFPQYAALSQRAELIAADREGAYKRELEAIEEAKREARRRASEEARRKYEEAKRRAAALYREALRKAAEQRRKQALLLAKRKRELERLRREREKALRVNPGEECKLPEVRREFRCRPGRLPDLPAPKTDD